MLQFDTSTNENREIIKIIGVGGGGGNAVNRMMKAGIVGVEYIVANTDLQHLRASEAETKIQLGERLTRGLGSGANPEIGQKAAEESLDEIRHCLEGTDMLFITAGMGGGTGTGAAPVIAKVAKEAGILTVAIVTKPFLLEGMKKMRKAEGGINELKKNVDTLIIIPNEKIFEISSKGTTLDQGFELANEVLKEGVRGITDVIKAEGILNVDFADIRTIMQDKGVAHMGTGRAKGEKRAVEAAEAAINSPLLETSVKGAEYVLINITGSKQTLTVDEFYAASDYIKATVNNDDAEFILGTVYGDEADEYLNITVIATGFKPTVSDSDHWETEESGPTEGSEKEADKPREFPVWIMRTNKK